MNRESITLILGLIRTGYPRFYANITKKEAEDTITLWHEMLKDIEPNACLSAVKSLIASSEYPPTIADVRKEVLKFEKKESVVEYWNEAYSMICNGIYMTQEQFDKHSDMCKRYFGSVNRLHEKAKTENLNLEVEQSLFNRYCENQIKENEHMKVIPFEVSQKMKELTKNIKLLD